METLYFDLLQFLYHFALVILVGGALVLGAAVAPALFATARSRAEAGTTFGGVLARFDALAIFAVVLLVVTSALKVGFEVTGVPEPRLVARWGLLLVLALATLYASAFAAPVARAFREQTRDFDDLPDTSPARREYAQLGRSAVRSMRVVVASGLVALFLS